jgi:flagellar assembly protein FliH
MTQPQHQPFVFSTEFDASGEVVSARPTRTVKRVYLAAEVEALVAQARAEAREQAMAELEGVQAMALAEIGQAVGRALPGLARVAHEHRAASADLALAAARIIAGSALEQTPQGPLHEALEALGHEIDATPRLVVRTGGLSDDARSRIEAVCAEAGFTGQVSFRDDPGMDVAAFALEWGDGRAEYSPEDSARRVGEALAAALAAEGGHAETLTAPEGDA